MSQVIRIRTHVYGPGALNNMGRIYESDTEPIAQAVENEVDAGAKNIWVEVYPDKICVTGNGHGMLPEMNDTDRKLLEEFFANPNNFSGIDIRELLDDLSLMSVTWMVSCFALSSKIPSQDANVKGARGIGAQSFRQIARQAEWLTKPSWELASRYWGSTISVDHIPTIRFIAPTEEELDANMMDWTIERGSDYILRDPYGSILQSGTQVVISRFKEGLGNSLRPVVIVDFLSRRFGSDILDRGLEIKVVDHVTEEGKKYPAGVATQVQPPSYRGFLILARDLQLRGNGQFRVELYYNPQGKHYPGIRRRKSITCPLTEVEALNRAPWCRGDIEGYIDYPNLPEIMAPWTPDKRRPAPSRILTQWIQAINALETEVEEQISEIKKKINEEKRKRITSTIEKSLKEAMSILPAYKGLLVVPQKPSKHNTGSNKPRRDERTLIYVFNQHSKGVSDVSLEVRKKGDKNFIIKKKTGSSGIISLGKLDYGGYSVSITNLPLGAVVDGASQQSCTVRINQPPQNIRFNLITNDPAPKRNKVNGIRLWLHDLDDPVIPYSIDRVDSMGTVEINTGTNEFREAILANDEIRQIELTCLYAAGALAEYGFKGEIQSLIYARAMELFVRSYAGAISEHMRETQRSSKRLKSRGN